MTVVARAKFAGSSRGDAGARIGRLAGTHPHGTPACDTRVAASAFTAARLNRAALSGS